MLRCPGENPVRLLFRWKFVCSVPGCGVSYSLSRSTLARAETQGQEFVFLHAASLPTGSCWGDACFAERQAVTWDRDCWSLLSLSPTGASCPRETSAQCFKWKSVLILSASREKKSVVFCACMEGLENITCSVAENVRVLRLFVWSLQPSNEQRADPLLHFSLKGIFL